MPGKKSAEFKKYDHELVASLIAEKPISMKDLILQTGYPKTAMRGIITELTYSKPIWEESSAKNTVFGMMSF